MVNTKEYYNMAVKGNTHFTNFQSSENKIPGGNCIFFRLFRYNTARSPPALDFRGKDFLYAWVYACIYRWMGGWVDGWIGMGMHSVG